MSRIITPSRDIIKYSGRFHWELYNPDGTLAKKGSFKNGTTLAGINDALSVYLAAGTQKTSWLLGLVNNAGFSAFSASDTMASHAGWAEWTSYSEGTRQLWLPGSVAGQSVTNPTAASFTISVAGTLAGGFLVSDSVKGGTTGILWATGAFSVAQAVTIGQVFRLDYTCNGTGA